MKSLHARLLEAGCELDHHEGDLYVKSSDTAQRIIREYKAEGYVVSPEGFRSAIDGTLWIDLPFHFDRPADGGRQDLR